MGFQLRFDTLNGALWVRKQRSIILKTVISASLDGLNINECGILNDWVGEAKF